MTGWWLMDVAFLCFIGAGALMALASTVMIIVDLWDRL